MALDERYIVASDLEQYFVDKDSGFPLANGTLTFYRDVARNVPKEVFQLSGSPPNYTYTSMGSQITLSSVGTVQNSGGDNEVIYYFPYDANGDLDLYYVVCRNENSVEQFTREAWPNITASSDPTQDPFPVQNQLSNPQFTQVFINEGISTTYSVTAAVNEEFLFAPNWTFVISGTGTVTVQRIAIAGNDNVITSPPYVIDVDVSSGITSCLLRQRLSTNSGLWASTDNQSIYLGGTLVARNENTGTSGVQMYYEESSGGSPVLILDASFTNADYSEVLGGTDLPIPLSTNTDTGTDGFVDIYLSFIPSSHIRISSVQVIPTASQASANLAGYDTNSSNRETALLGDYYIPRLKTRPAGNILTGWDFLLNPAQLGENQSINNTSGYIWDQTIAQGSAASVGRNPVTGGFTINTSGANGSLMMVQYLSGAEARKVLGTPLSVNVSAFQVSGDPVTLRVYMYTAGNAGSFPTLPTMLGTVASNGQFTLTAANWSVIPRGGLPVAQAEIPFIVSNTDLNDDLDIQFSGWEIVDPIQIGVANKFAIVVTLAWPDASTLITIDSISVCCSEIPSRPELESFDEVLRQCQYYYEKSTNQGIVPSSGSLSGPLLAQQYPTRLAVLDYTVLPRSFSIQYNIPKRIAVSPTLYSISGAVNNVLVLAFEAGTTVINTDVLASNWAIADIGQRGCNVLAVDRSVPIAFTNATFVRDNAEAFLLYHYIADARLGVV